QGRRRRRHGRARPGDAQVVRGGREAGARREIHQCGAADQRGARALLALTAVDALEVAAVVFAILYLLLVIRENVWCWPVALAGTLLSLVVFVDAKLYMESALQVFYAVMALYGWYQWVRGGDSSTGVAIGIWPAHRHAAALAAILVGTVL